MAVCGFSKQFSLLVWMQGILPMRMIVATKIQTILMNWFNAPAYYGNVP